VALTVEIKPACLRDASFVLGNLNRHDEAEVRCQLPEGVSPGVLAHGHVALPKALVAYVNDVPATFFGVGWLNAGTTSVWAVSTSLGRRAMPEVTRHFRSDLVPWMLEHGAVAAEARSLATNTKAHEWMRSLGAEQHGPAFPFGRGGEPFLLFRWTVAGYRSIYQQAGSEV
jgi:hypothetical protein